MGQRDRFPENRLRHTVANGEDPLGSRELTAKLVGQWTARQVRVCDAEILADTDRYARSWNNNRERIC